MGTEEEKKDEHRLQNDWVLWEHKGSSGSKNPNQWKENMSELCHFTTVQEFWQYFEHIPKPSEVFFDGEFRKRVGAELKTVEEYSLFKKGIEPEWGDPLNVSGGEWFCRQCFEPEVLDSFWMNLVLGVVGETIEHASDEERTYEDHINGVRVIDKSRGQYPTYKIELWMNTKDEKIRNRVKDALLQVMTEGVPSSSQRKMQPKFEWKDHS